MTELNYNLTYCPKFGEYYILYLFAGDKFITSNRKLFSGQKLNGLEFDFYDMEDPVTDGTGPILFNSEYGLLAINNVFGPTIIFLKKKDSTLIEQIIDNLNE